MKPTDLSNHICNWFSGTGPFADIVISSRVRLARNLAGYEFLTRISPARQAEVKNRIAEVLLNIDFGEKLHYIDIDPLEELDRDLLMERHLISKRLSKGTGPRGVVFTESEEFTAMINEEDHLRIQVLMTGLQIKQAWRKINEYDNLIESKLRYAFSEKYGYLTACPTNVGTGIRVSVMLHLPGLKMTNQLEKFLNAARDTNLAVRGLFGEGSEAVGDFFQLSNQITLGKSEQQIVDKLHDHVVPKIIQYEAMAREELVRTREDVVEDKIQRALGVLKNARMISSQEALFLLSNVRMGVNLKRVKDIPITTINELFMLTQPAHLQANSGSTLTPDRRDVKRAEIIRSKLSLN